MLTRNTLVVRYAAFAAIATVCNLAAQALTLEIYGRWESLALSILCGTLVGFAVKYLLDKNFIFFDGVSTLSHEFRKIVLYGFTAVGTTLVFWALEYSFWAIWMTSFAKYTGAVLGLCIGYVLKYTLDRRFVFLAAGAHA